jgi:hypothetical protein
MLSFDEVADVVKKSTFYLESLHRTALSSLHFYRHSGGQGSSWRTVGFYLDISSDNRLVLEALYLSRLTTCVVRVYQESPLEIVFARKFSLDGDPRADLLHLATETFGRRLPVDLPAQERVPASLGLEVAQAMLPVPPPVDVTAVPA